jgi:hypothetical protein
MTTWNQAVKQSAPLRRAADSNPELARELWLATKGEGDPAADSYAEAAYDLAPTEYASLLSSGGAANAYAVDCLWQHVEQARCASPHEQRELAREAWQRFNDRAEKAGDVEYGLGFDQSLAWECTREFDTTVARGMGTVEEIARLAGRMKAQLSKAKASKVCAAPEEIYDVELGSDVGRLLPSELIHLGEPTEVVLLDALADSRALQYAMKGSSEAGRGPLVIALDESGSMHNSRGVWAKAAAIALIRTAWEDGRVCAVVHWSTHVATRVLRPGDSAGLLAVLKHWFGGGNECQLALDNAADLVDTLQAKGDRGADVILVTDGVEDMTPEHDAAIDRIEARQSRLWTIGIECPIDEGACIRARAEQYTHLDTADVERGEIGALQGSVI